MRPLARLMWQLVRWPGVFALCLVSAMFVLMSKGSGPSLNDVLITGFLIITMLGARILSIASLPTWRMLPDGHRTLVRALAALTLITSLILGGLAAWVEMWHFTDQPLANIALPFVALSGLSFLIFVRDLRGRAKLLGTLGILGATALTLVAMPRLPAVASGFAAALYAFLWVLALRSRDVPRSAFTGAAESRDAGTHTPLAHLRAHALLARSPTGSILNGGRSLFAKLSVALIVTTLCAVIYQFILGDRASFDNYPLIATLVACTGAALMLGQSWETPARARLLWLLSGASRTGIFRLAERTLIANLAVLSLVSWLVVSGLALVRGLHLGAAEALFTLAGFVPGALIAIYFGLILPTLTRWWQRIPIGTLAGLAVVFTPALWIRRVIVDATDSRDFTHTALLVALVAACVLLRAIAVFRWKEIDWTCVRPEIAWSRR
jgi:hypothetical protein